MERIISYEELPYNKDMSVYFRMETDPKLYIYLMKNGYKIVNNIIDADNSTIFITGRRQDYESTNGKEYKKIINKGIENTFSKNGITKPVTTNFNYKDLLEHKYRVPFVLKNENQNGGREKFLINTEEDYEKLISACDALINKFLLSRSLKYDKKFNIDYYKYLVDNFTVQEYIKTPSNYNTTVRLLTTPSNNLLYSSLKYNKQTNYKDDTTLLGYILNEVFPLSTKSIVSNTLSGGNNILLGENNYSSFDTKLLKLHGINSDNFIKLVDTTKKLHYKYRKELGIICGFDFIYNVNDNKWYLLEYHSRPMLGDYSKRQNIKYNTNEERLTVEGRVRATALRLSLKNN